MKITITAEIDRDYGNDRLAMDGLTNRLLDLLYDDFEYLPVGYRQEPARLSDVRVRVTTVG